MQPDLHFYQTRKVIFWDRVQRVSWFVFLALAAGVLLYEGCMLLGLLPDIRAMMGAPQ